MQKKHLKQEEIKNRTSRGYVEEAETIAFNLQSIADHLGDLPEVGEILDLIEIANVNRQEVLATIKPDVDYRYHCAYKHILMARGQLLELIQATKRSGDLDRLVKLLNVFDNVKKLLNFIRARYYRIDVDNEDCSRCLDDLVGGI